MVGRSTIDLVHRGFGFFDLTVSVVEARGLGKEENTHSKVDGPDEAHTHWNTPSTRVIALMFEAAVIDASRQEDTKRDEELIIRN